MQKPNPNGNEWLNIKNHQPEFTGKFDCEILDGGPMIYPAQWIPPGKSTGFGNETGPGWRVLIPQEGKRPRVQFKHAQLLPKWRPQPRKRSKQGKH